jgi:hypothetical protein
MERYTQITQYTEKLDGSYLYLGNRQREPSKVVALASTGCGSVKQQRRFQQRCFSHGFGLDRVPECGATETLLAPVL